MKFIFSSLVLLSLSLLVKIDASENGKPEVLIQKIFELAGKENVLNNPTLKKELDSYVDFKQMSLNILGAEAKKRTADDLKWFETSIKEIITKTVYPEAPEFLKNVKITYRTTLIDGNSAIVPSAVSKRGERTDVSYKLHKVGSDWKVIDVSIDEESWVKTINDSMRKTLTEKGWPGVKDLLNKRLTTLNNSNQPKKQ